MFFIPRNVSPQNKLQAVSEYLAGKGSQKCIAKKYGCDQKSLSAWINNYKVFGESAFIRTGHNQNYSSEFRNKVVQSFLSGEGSYEELAIKFKIPARSTVRSWIMKYNDHEEFKSSGTGGGTIMTKGRTTTFDERIEIVQYCIAHNHNYIETAEKYQVSYQQARNYTVKYKSDGIDALKDNRGKRKSKNEMTELERLRAENRILRAEKERAEMEASFLKKLEEIERRRG